MVPLVLKHHTTHMVCCNFAYVLGAPASLIGSELSSLLGSDPSICLVLMSQGHPCADIHRIGERQTYAPPSPSLEVSKHRPSVKKSSIWARKKSPILGMCSAPPRQYNPVNRQAGYPLNLPPPESGPAFLLPYQRLWAVWNAAKSKYSILTML
jgi:hypothetical protein